MHLSIKSPCSENWETMQIGSGSRFCSSCEKNVIDFTAMSQEEILEYFSKNQGKKTCGRFSASQLEYAHPEILITAKIPLKPEKNSNLPFYLLTLGTMMVAACNTPETKEADGILKNDTIPKIEIHKDSTKSLADSNELVKKPRSENITSFPPPDIMVMGDVAEDPFEEDTTQPRRFAEVMPRFAGNPDSSYIIYLRENIVYPEFESINKIEGKVFARFVVDKTGKVRDAEIIKGVSKNFDAEALRVISNMPDWSPAQDKGKAVDLQMILPIRFMLE